MTDSRPRGEFDDDSATLTVHAPNRVAQPHTKSSEVEVTPAPALVAIVNDSNATAGSSSTARGSSAQSRPRGQRHRSSPRGCGSTSVQGSFRVEWSRAWGSGCFSCLDNRRVSRALVRTLHGPCCGLDPGRTAPILACFPRPNDVRASTEPAGEPNFAVLRQAALNLLKHVKGTEVGIKIRRLRAGWDNDFTMQVLGASC